MPKRRNRLFWLVLRASPLGLSAALLVWSLSASPFTRPLVAASEEQIRRSLDRALAGRVTPDWLAAELDAGLAVPDIDRIETLLLIGADRGIAPRPAQQVRVDALMAAQAGLWEDTKTCGLCMADIGQCRPVKLMATCNIPFELTPAGDLNALRRAGVAAWNGEDVDKLDVALSLVGLGATAAILVSGGGSGPVKVGATVLRVGSKVTPDFKKVLARLADVDLKVGQLMPYALGRVELDKVADTAKLTRLADVSRDLARVAGKTSLADAVVLLRHVDSAEDARRLARLADVAGPGTRPVMEVLGKRRVFRALVRLSDMAVSAVVLIYAVALNLMLWAGGQVGIRVWRGALRGFAARGARG